MSKSNYNSLDDNKYNEYENSKSSNNKNNIVYSNINKINNILDNNYSFQSKSTDSGNGKSNNEINSVSSDDTISILSSISFNDDSPITRYIKSLNLYEKNCQLSLPTNNIEKDKKLDKEKKNKDNTNKKKYKKNKELQSKDIICKNKQNIFIPQYDSDWFETENNLSLEMYLKKLFIIARDNLQCNLNKNTTKAILVPHSRIKYSGLCSASAYYELHNCTIKIKRIIILCTNNQSNDIISTSYTNIASYRIGKPKLYLDTNTIEKLSPYVEINNELFEKEYSFLNQLPFIETIAPDALICPLLIGNIIFTSKNINKIRLIMEILRKLLQKDGTVLVCTSNLSYINGNYKNKINTYINENIKKSDNEILLYLYNLIDGVKGRNNKLDEMLYLQNSPSYDIITIYLFGKLLNSLSNGNKLIDLYCSDNFSDNSIIKKSINYPLSNNFKVKHEPEYLGYKKCFYSRISCYYTSLSRKYINIFNFNKNQLTHLLEISKLSISSISYAGIVFTTQANIQSRNSRKIDMLCSEYEKIALLGLAREQLYNKLSSNLPNNTINNNIKIPENLIQPIYSPIFNLNLGVFVTLYKVKEKVNEKIKEKQHEKVNEKVKEKQHEKIKDKQHDKVNEKNNEIHGCIGTLETNNSENTIVNNVKKYVIDAALKDIRYIPIEIKEFNMLEFSITILYNTKQITLNNYFSNKFILGHDGILIDTGKKQGYLLPSVATEFGYNKQELLKELCINKIGNNIKDCFRTSNTQLFYNEGIEFNTYS